MLSIVVNDFVYCRPGVFDHIEGFDELQNSGIINEYHVIRPKGWIVQGITSSSDRIVGVNIVAKGINEFNAKHRQFVTETKIINGDGDDIMRHDLLPPLESRWFSNNNEI